MVEENYRNPACTVDVIIENEREEILLILRENEPFQGMWAFPGGYINYGTETLEKAAFREALEETCLLVSSLKLLGVYSDPNRDPREHTITHVYSTRHFSGNLEAKDDAKDARWFSIYSLPPLAFDHNKILSDYMEVRGK